MQARGREGARPAPSLDVRAPAARRATVKRGRGGVVKGVARRRALVDGWDSILFAAHLPGGRQSPWRLLGGKLCSGRKF